MNHLTRGILFLAGLLVFCAGIIKIVPGWGLLSIGFSSVAFAIIAAPSKPK